MRTVPLSVLALLPLFSETARADNTAQVRLSLVNATITARDSANQPLWTRTLDDCSGTATIMSSYGGEPDNYKWIYRFSDSTPLTGTLGEFGTISFSTGFLSGNGRFAPSTSYTNVSMLSNVTLLGKTFSPINGATLSFDNTSSQDLSLIGGDLPLRNPSFFIFFNFGGDAPARLTFGGTPTLRVEIIPAPGALAVLGGGLLAAGRRRRER